MPLKVSSNNKGTWITWETPDESVSSTFRIKPEDDDEKVLAILFKATRFIAAQMGAMAVEIAELEMEIRGGAPTDASAMRSTPRTATTAAPATAVDPNAPRIPMMSPASLSDKPSDGGPVNPEFGWASMPTNAIPEPLAGQWEMIPPGEM